MFESAEIDHHLDPEEYKKAAQQLRLDLLEAQFELLERRDKAVVVVVGGVDGAGKGDTVNLLQRWLDPRHVDVQAFDRPTDAERERPFFDRYFRRIPEKGKVGIFFASWHSEPIMSRVFRETRDVDLDHAMEQVRHFERMLTHEGVVLLKLWFHLSKTAQKQRLRALESDPLTAWRVTDTDWQHARLYDRFRKVSTRAVRETSTEYAPWLIVPGKEPRYREITVGRAVLEALRSSSAEAEPSPVRPAPPLDGLELLHAVDLGGKLAKKPYRRELEVLQGRISIALRKPGFQKHRSLVLALEGWDAAGKGGAIRRFTAALDARTYRVVPIAAPTDEEKARPYLWRFARHLPRRGKVVIYDRSWYGRVLVERVEGFCSVADWTRAYGEINDFEEQLVESGAVVVKLFLHISSEEQLRRFEAREKSGIKRHKLTDEDWRNRERRPDYESAVTEMVDRTSTEIAPWTLVAAEDKRSARITCLRTIADALEASG